MSPRSAALNLRAAIGCFNLGITVQGKHISFFEPRFLSEDGCIIINVSRLSLPMCLFILIYQQRMPASAFVSTSLGRPSRAKEKDKRIQLDNDLYGGEAHNDIASVKKMLHESASPFSFLLSLSLSIEPTAVQSRCSESPSLTRHLSSSSPTIVLVANVPSLPPERCNICDGSNDDDDDNYA